MNDYKQFIIQPQPVEKVDFCILPLCNGLFLSYHKDLHIDYSVNNLGQAEYCILGWAFQSAPEKGTPSYEIKKAKSVMQIDEIVETWSGRWMLIWHNELRMDACGLLGCFYTYERVFSSSITLINELMKRDNISPRLAHQFGLDYYPGPRTVYSDIFRLLPSESIDLNTLTRKPHSLFTGNYSLLSEKTRIEALLNTFSTLLMNVQKNYPGELVLALSGGYDSRLMMAFLEREHIHYSAMTLDHGNISPEDRLIPKQLAELRKIPYSFIRRVGKPDKKRYAEFDDHCSGQSVDEDRNFYAFKQYPEGDSQIALLRCGIPEITVPNYITYAESSGYDIKKFCEKIVNIRGRKDIQASLKEWLETGFHDSSLDFSSDYYWNQRAGCWLSSVEQSLTILKNTDSFQLFNCAHIIGLLMGFSYEQRQSKAHELTLIKAACPELLTIPFRLEIREPKVTLAKKALLRKLRYFKNLLTCLDKGMPAHELKRILSR